MSVQARNAFLFQKHFIKRFGTFEGDLHGEALVCSLHCLLPHALPQFNAGHRELQ
jgi:hypothetical protein